jgi:hypothetical protein
MKNTKKNQYAVFRRGLHRSRRSLRSRFFGGPELLASQVTYLLVKLANMTVQFPGARALRALSQ